MFTNTKAYHWKEHHLYYTIPAGFDISPNGNISKIKIKVAKK
jgi:hypothetical protein